MPFRAKAKTLFKTRSKSNSSSPSNESNHEVYKPGEQMPPPKYRRAPAKEHTEKLEAFSFGDSWRKRSFQSVQSPGGTRASSRRASIMSTGRKSRKTSVQIEDAERGQRVDSRGDGPERKDVVGGAAMPPSRLTELQGGRDDELTRVPTIGRKPAVERSHVENKHTTGARDGLHRVSSTAHDHTPFTEQDFASALHRSRLPIFAQS